MASELLSVSNERIGSMPARALNSYISLFSARSFFISFKR